MCAILYLLITLSWLLYQDESEAEDDQSGDEDAEAMEEEAGIKLTNKTSRKYWLLYLFYPPLMFDKHCIVSVFLSAVAQNLQVYYSGEIRTHDPHQSRADASTTRPPSLPTDDRPVRILY